MANEPNNGYWFPAKRYGWGWGVPQRWQGWVVLAVFAALIAAGAAFLPQLGPLLFLAYSAAVCAVLVAVCWLKGEPPSWRRGGK